MKMHVAYNAKSEIWNYFVYVTDDYGIAVRLPLTAAACHYLSN